MVIIVKLFVMIQWMWRRSQVLKLLKEGEILEGVNINLNKELGRGSYATVYQAEWRSLSCVAKVFHAVIFPSYPAETWKQLAREIELLQHVRHPNIVQLLGFTETHSKIPSVIMERLDTNLTALIEEHHSLLSFNMQACILHDVAVGLNFLHEEPIIHRDLSSNNILLTEHLVAKISDLGLAKHIKSAEQQAGSLVGFGTQDYMPPEVLGQKPPQISPKTDMFSFGVVMLQVATGRPPDVRGRLNVDAETDRRKHHLELLGESLFRPLILQCLNDKSGNRPTAIVLCKDLKKLGAARISTLKLTKVLQEDKVEFEKQLEAFQLQRDSDIENMQKQQEEIMVLQTKVDEEKAAAVSGTKKVKAELNVALNKNIQLEKRLSTEKETQNKLHAQIIQLKDKVMEAVQCQSLGNVKQLVEQNQELAELLESTNNNLIMYKKSYSALKELLDSLNLENAPALDTINNKLQKCKNDRKYMLVNLEDMESRLLLIKQSLEDDKGVLQRATAVSTNNQVVGTGKEAGMVDEIRVRVLQEKLLKAEQERDESKRSMEQSNAVLNNRIRRLQDQLNVTSAGDEAGMVDEIRKLNMRISELESTEHMMKESSSSQSEIERQYHQQLQQLEQKCAEQKEHIVSLEAVCAMQQVESFEGIKKELEKNKGVIAQLQARIEQLQMDLQAHDVQYKRVASSLEDAHQKQTDLLKETKAAVTKSIELTEENAKLQEQNFYLVEDMKSLKEKLQQQGRAGGYLPNDDLNVPKKENARLKIEVDNMVAAPSDDDGTTCPLCHVTLDSESELQLHYLQSCAGYDNEVAVDPMSTKPMGYPPVTLRLVKFVWYPSDPFKVHEQKVILLSSFTASEGSVELFKDKNEDITSYSSSTISVRIGKIDDGQIVVGEEMLEVEPYEVSNDSDEIYLIEKETNLPGPPPVNPKVATAKDAGVQERVTHLSTPTPIRQKAKSTIKQVETANGKQDVSCEPVSSTTGVKKGQRVVVCRATSNEYGTVRAVNVAIEGRKGYTGVEMDLPSGATDGEVKGVRHFRCKPKHAIFVQPKYIFKIVE